MNNPLLSADYGLPEDLVKLINESVQRFEDQWGAMKALAKANGWLESYRVEITKCVREAYNKGVEMGLEMARLNP